MAIDCLQTVAELDAVKENWDSVFAADSQATVFVSWGWLRALFAESPFEWRVLAFKPNGHSAYTAFFPLAIETDRLNLFRVLRMGGAPVSDYTGFVCHPDSEAQAISAFADYVQRMAWDRFHMKDVLDPRLDLFLQPFVKVGFDVQDRGQIVCPYITLPPTWDAYLKEQVTSRTRESLKRRTRQLNRLPGFRVEPVDETNLDTNIAVLLDLWQARWGRVSFPLGRVIRRYFEHGSLWLDVMWHEQTPVAALSAFCDYPHRVFAYFISGFNPDYGKYSPGRVIVGHSIRYAIENGFQTYDFLRGDEAYKYSFGAVERVNRYVLLTGKGIRSRVANTAIQGIKRLRRG